MTIQSLVSSDPRLDRACAAFDKGDFFRAFAEYLPAAQEGNAIAQSMVGWMCEAGSGTVASVTEAERWYRLAADQDYDDGCFLLAQLLDTTGRTEAAVPIYEKAANLGSLAAAYKLGAYKNKYNTDDEFWLRKAANAGHVFAALLLGRRMITHRIAGGVIKGAFWVIRGFWTGIKIIWKSPLPNVWDDPRLGK